MKKQYQKPEQRVVVLQHRCQILAVSELHGVGGNGDVNYGGGGSGPARARQHGGIDWDDDWSE